MQTGASWKKPHESGVAKDWRQLGNTKMFLLLNGTQARSGLFSPFSKQDFQLATDDQKPRLDSSSGPADVAAPAPCIYLSNTDDDFNWDGWKEVPNKPQGDSKENQMQ